MAAEFPAAIATMKEPVNNLSLDLTADVSIGDGTVYVLATTGAPTAGAFHIENDIYFYTGKTASSLTGCVGGQDGSTNVDHLKTIGGEVVFGPEAHYVKKLNEEIVAIEANIGITGAKNFVTANGAQTIYGIKDFQDAPVLPASSMATGAEVTTGTDNTKIVTPKAIGDAGVWSACTAPTFDVATYDNGSGGQPTHSQCRKRRSKNLYEVYYIGSGVKAGADSIINFSLDVALATTLQNVVVGNAAYNVGGVWLLAIILAGTGAGFVFMANASIADNAVIAALTFTVSYEV